MGTGDKVEIDEMILVCGTEADRITGMQETLVQMGALSAPNAGQSRRAAVFGAVADFLALINLNRDEVKSIIAAGRRRAAAVAKRNAKAKAGNVVQIDAEPRAEATEFEAPVNPLPADPDAIGPVDEAPGEDAEQ